MSRDTRYSLVDGYSLRIASVRPSDQSSYTCSLDTEPLTELTHRLVVLCEYRAELFAAIDAAIFARVSKRLRCMAAMSKSHIKRGR